MQIKKYILLLASVLLVVACSNDDFTHQEPIQDGPVKVGFWMGRGDSENTRTFINDDGQTISWEAEDKVALWAQKDNVYTFQNQTFDTWFVAAETNQAFFTTTLPEAMPEGTYTYYACYPKPQSVSGTTATFTLPSMQDGKMGGGADIMVAQGTGPALEKLYTPADPNNSEVVPDYIIEDGLTLNMHHLIHALRFYVPAGKWGFPTGETVERIVFTMPANVAGTVTADVSNTNGLTLTSGGTNTISLNLKEPIGASTADNGGNVTYDYAVAAILPPSTNYESNDKLVVKTYSQSRVATQEISLNGRGSQAADEKMRMAAGRVTPVGLNCLETVNQYVLRIKWGGNNLGENVNIITFYDENGNEISALTITDVANKFKKVGDYYDIDLSYGNQSDIDAVKALAGKNITVKYDSDHAIVSTNFIFPSGIENGFFHEETLTVPYLFFEDFSNIDTFDNHCDVGVGTSSSSAGNKNAEAFTWLNGYTNNWKGSRAGGNAGHAVRMSCRFEGGGAGKATAYATYPGRIDSAPITNLKSPVKVKIIFDYIGGQDSWMMDANKEKGGTYGNPVLAYGYNTAGSIDFDGGDQIPSILKSGIHAETTGVWNSTFHTITDYIDNCPNNTCLSWRVTVNRVGSESSWTGIFGANGNHYIYLDNIKVQIVSE